MPAGSSTNIAPAAEAFARYPASWYLFGASADLAARPVSKQMLGRNLVGFRTESGKAVVMEAGILKTDVKYEEIIDMSFVESIRASL